MGTEAIRDNVLIETMSLWELSVILSLWEKHSIPLREEETFVSTDERSTPVIKASEFI